MAAIRTRSSVGGFDVSCFPVRIHAASAGCTRVAEVFDGTETAFFVT
jgi:hypothetical protein